MGFEHFDKSSNLEGFFYQIYQIKLQNAEECFASYSYITLSWITKQAKKYKCMQHFFIFLEDLKISNSVKFTIYP